MLGTEKKAREGHLNATIQISHTHKKCLYYTHHNYMLVFRGRLAHERTVPAGLIARTAANLTSFKYYIPAGAAESQPGQL